MLDYLESLGLCSTQEDVWKLLLAKMDAFGFDRLVYGFTRFGTETSVGPHEDALILSNHEPGYFKRFIEEGHYMRAPLADWAMKNTGTRSWSYIGQDYEKMTDKQRRVVDFNIANGVVAGYSISFRNASTRTRAVLALTARSDLTQSDVNELWARDGREIEAICNMAHLKMFSLPVVIVSSRLSRRQQEVLEWVADGKTNQDIATIMKLSAATIEKHLRLAREKLNVETTAQAVLKASFLNQMFIVRV